MNEFGVINLKYLKASLHFLLYHRLQIPVPYPTLALLVDKISKDEAKTNFFLERHREQAVGTFHDVQRIVDVLEDVTYNNEINWSCAAISFGPTPVLSKEVWFIKLPESGGTAGIDHLSDHHLARTVAQTIL